MAIERIKEALSEIRAAARHDPVAAAAQAGEAVRAKWLERLFAALQEDDPPYIESLGDHWGELCVTAELASRWADDLMPILRRVQQERKRGVFAHFFGTSVCYSALFKSGRHEELLELLEHDPHPIWPYLVWGGRVLLARGQIDEAIAYMQSRAGINTPEAALARFAEEALLQAGRSEAAYERYAIEANQANSRLATYRAIAKKYPLVEPDRLLRDLIASTPREAGKWFATAKSLKRLDLAVELAWASPCDPKTLTRAARDHLDSQPAFAVQAAVAALHWIAEGYGYELKALDAREAYGLAVEAANGIGRTDQVQHGVQQMIESDRPGVTWLRQALGFAAS